MSASASSDKNLLCSIIKDASGMKLFDLLNSVPGKKDLILDNQLISSLDYIATFTQLKDCNMEKLYKLEPGAAPGVTDKCIYIIRPNIKNAKIISDQINANKSYGRGKKFWLINVPRKFYCCERILEKEGVYDKVIQMELPICFFTLDKDLLSLELPNFFDEYYHRGDLINIHTAALALVQLCRISGPIPKIFGQGRCSEKVLDLMNVLMEEISIDPLQSERISHLVILDRDIDLISVLLSQLTYEGMLDEVFGINNSRVVFPKEVTKKDDSLKVVLNSNDVIYKEIRNSFFASVFGFLSNKAKELQAKSETTKMSVADMKNFVTNEIRNFRQQQTSLSLHIGACEVIMQKKNQDNFQEHLQVERNIIENRNIKEAIQYIEDLINQQEPFERPLRLMCLLCITQDGLLSSEYQTLATQFRQSYGCKFLPTLYTLRKLGLLVEQTAYLPTAQTKVSKKIIEKVVVSKASKIAEKVATAVTLSRYSNFKLFLRKFNLIPNEEDPDLKNPKSMAYVFGGAYVPLIGRITEQVVVNGSLKLIEEAMRILPGRTIIRFKSDKETGYVQPTTEFESKTILVYVLGGITFAEIAALRLLGQLNGCKILIASTSIINGTSFLKILNPLNK